MAISELTKETTNDGAFNRQTNSFDTPFGDEPGKLPVEAGRYRLLVAMICPWANRQLIARELLGLQDAISVGVTHSVRTANGWRFSLDEDGQDPVLGYEYVTDAYLKADPNYDKRATVPAVVDLTTGAVVNNDYHRLTNYWEVEWSPLHKENAPVLYPEPLRTQIDDLNEWLFHNVNNGVYKCGFARSQSAYDKAYDALFAALDTVEERLSTQRFLFGDHITDSDIRLYVTLARFDAAYYARFRTNRQRLIDFTHLWGYARDLYETDGFGSTTDFEAIKLGYFSTLGDGSNSEVIVPKGPDTSGWTQPHDRAQLSSTPEEKFRRAQD